MKQQVFAILAPTLLAMAQPSSAISDETKGVQLITPSSTFCVSDEQIINRTNAAEAGNVRDMVALHWHYLGCEVNRELAFYWGKRAADACDAEMQDSIEQWLHSFRDKSIERIVPATILNWERRCSARSH